MKREIIFDIPDNPEYRAVCRFGYECFIPFAWFCHIQKKRYYKKWLFFGEIRFKWIEVDRCWWKKQISTMDDLKKSAMSFYEETVLWMPRLVKQAMEL